MCVYVSCARAIVCLFVRVSAYASLSVCLCVCVCVRAYVCMHVSTSSNLAGFEVSVLLAIDLNLFAYTDAGAQNGHGCSWLCSQFHLCIYLCIYI